MVNKVWKISTIILVSFGFLVLESIVKYTLVNKIPPEGFYLFKPILQIVYTPNYNIAFSLPLPFSVIIFFVVSALIFLSFVWWLNLIQDNLKLFVAVSLIIVGALSNLLDRLIFGYVIDYILIPFWPVFNLADCLIVAGIGIYVIMELKGNTKLSKVNFKSNKEGQNEGQNR